ncbi:MAG: SDR family NAD(P)-dependent oxidoreductase [Alphaproteobacteria bacterium]|nr:SDR family NAD(P)-dependent oxidoreductase [Alphaproteobacteria bacterium]
MAGLCEGRVAIVTGGGRGIGREYCLMLAAEGAKVVVNDLGAARDGVGADASPAQQVVDEIRAAGGEAVANGADVSDWAGAKGMIDQAISAFGRLDVLINNAGILRDRMLVNMTEAEWDAVIKVHLKGTFAPTHHAANYWRDLTKATGEPANARVINTSSVSGIYGNIGQTNYGAAKQGIAAFTIIAARELRRYGVTVNAIAPGALTRLTEDLGVVTEERKASGDPKWVAPIAVWLASAESKDVSGRMFEASGTVLGIAEGWHRGPTATPVKDPKALGPIVADLVARARKNAGMDGQDLD